MSENGTDAAIRFSAAVARVQTLADGGIRLTLDLPEDAVGIAAEMMEAKRAGAVLEVAALAIVRPNELGNWQT